ncbi:MAG: amidase [Deltaproteobacteria bacterium]|nr:amidase [Deltaproteobacteria bacterium]
MPTTYDLKSVKMPRLAGKSLNLFAALVESELAGRAFRQRILASGGLLRARQTPLEEAPTFLPLAPGPVRRPQEAKAPLALEPILVPPRPAAPFVPARDYAAAYREGRTTPLRVANAVLEAIDESEACTPALRAFVALDRDDLARQAALSTERHRQGAPLGPLDGVPVAIKDELDQVPYSTSGGTRFYGKRRPSRDATTVARLRAAGALLVGKTNMHEIGIDPTGSNVHFGQNRNPYDPSRDTCGSSSGSATAVSAGLVPLALGADGGGSVRIPSALCGVVGLKPTFGRLSEQGAMPLCWSVAHIGPIGATAEDVALAYAAVAGPDADDPGTLAQPAPTLEGWDAADLRGVRLGVYPAWFEHASPEVVRVARSAVDALVGAGAQLREIEVPDLDLMRVAHAIIILSEMATSMADFPEDRHLLGSSVRLTLAATRELRPSDYVWAQRVRTRALAHFARLFGEVDAIVTPSTAITAPVLPAAAGSGGWSDLSCTTELMRYAFPGNLAGLPAISFPAGYDSSGLPVGLQAIANHWNEALLLRLARIAGTLVERHVPARIHRPLAKATS